MATTKATKKPVGAEALPAGDAKRDAQKAQLAALEEQAAALSDELGVQSIDPAKLAPEAVEREVRRAISPAGDIYISKQQPDYRYAMIYRDPSDKHGNTAAFAMEALGWERVMGDHPEAREHTRGPSRERWISDCLLMRIRKDRWEHLQLDDRKRRLLQQEGITAGLIATADKFGVSVRNVETDERLARLIGAPSPAAAMRRVPSSAERRQAFARSVACEILTETSSQ
jgi:hypothetical protein